jgi:hypothetical protein
MFDNILEKTIEEFIHHIHGIYPSIHKYVRSFFIDASLLFIDTIEIYRTEVMGIKETSSWEHCSYPADRANLTENCWARPACVGQAPFQQQHVVIEDACQEEAAYPATIDLQALEHAMDRSSMDTLTMGAT